MEDQRINRTSVLYTFVNSEGQRIKFIQQPLDSGSFSVDSEHSDTVLIEIEEYTVYYRIAGNMHYYLWNDGKYALKINSALELSDNELLLIINGLKVKQ